MKFKRSHTFLIKHFLAILLAVSSFMTFSQSVCPPTDAAKLKLMDANIQELLADPAKFSAFADQIFKNSNDVTELATILKRIKDKAPANFKGDQPVKGITSTEDWARLRVIVCPYLMKDVPAVAKEVTILFRGVSHKNNDRVTVDYDTENFLYDFEMQDIPDVKGKWIGWEVFGLDQDLSRSAIKGFPDAAQGPKFTLDGSFALTYRIVGKYGENTVTIFLTREKKTFAVKNFRAVDSKTETRVAKENEILYLVRRNEELSRTVNFIFDTDALKQYYSPGEPIWQKYRMSDEQRDVDAPIRTTSDREFSASREKNGASYRFDNWSESATVNVGVFGTQRVVNIKLLTEDRTSQAAALPGGLDKKISDFLGAFSQIGERLSDLTGKEITTQVKSSVVLNQYNIEDENSRYYYAVKETSIAIEGSISAELPVPGLNYIVPNVFQIGVYVKPEIKVRLEGGGTDRKRSESEIWAFYALNFGGGISGGIEAGIKAELLTKTETVELELNGFASARVSGDAQFSRAPSEDPPFTSKFIISVDPLVLGVTAKASVHTTLLNMELFNYSHEWWITDRINWESGK